MSKDRSKRSDETEGSETHSDGGNDSETSPGDSEGDEQAHEEEPAAGDGKPIAIDDVFELLSQPGNRYILTYLLRADTEEVTYSELVEHVLETAETPEAQDRAEFRGQIAARLVHSNLPKLEETGLVDVDADAQTVTATADIDVVVPYLELAMEQSIDTQ